MGVHEMSVQDDIFDIESVVEGTENEKIFASIVKYLGDLEERVDKYEEIIYHIRELKRLLEE